MSNLQQTNESGSGLVAVPMDEQVVSEPAKINCWEGNFAEQFPISSVDSKANIVTVIVGPPHLDYKIITHLKNQKMDGGSTLISDKSVLIATLTFVEGIANGPCTIFDENGNLFFEGSFVNGYRQGQGKEYDENGNVVFDGLFEKGVKLLKMAQMDGYWKEYDNNMNLQSVSKKDDQGNNDGICYYYENGVICRLSEWHEGKETPFSGFFKLFDEANRRWIEGEYKDGIRNGVVKELDENGRLISECFYLNGIKLNVVRLNEMEGYWKEYDENGNLKSVCKLDKCGRYEGYRFCYENGEVKRISEWRDGIEYALVGSLKFYDISQSKWVDRFCNGSIILNKHPMTEMEGFWKEFDDSGNLIHICEIDDNGNYNGLCYYFENGVLQKICRWEGGKEVPFNGYYKVYDTVQKQWIEGYYENDKQLKMVRSTKMEGYWKEYDENGKLKCICKKDNQGRYEGICYFYENGIIIKISEWHEGKEISLDGVCKIYDEYHNVRYEGEFRNGRREGKCTEYDDNGHVVFEGYIKSGNRLTPMETMKHFWEERDSDGNLCRICELNDDGQYDGLSYHYQDNQIRRVSRWNEDQETEVMKLFANGVMTVLNNDKKQYVGGFNDSIIFNYQREGEGEEYDIDGETLLYRGSYKKGKRNGQGKLYHLGNVVYDGEWIEGLQKYHYYLFLALALILMLIISILCFCLGNAYIGSIVSGIFISAICYYYKRDAGYIATSLLLVMICFFINIYIGIFATGLFLIYILFLISMQYEWKQEAVMFGAGTIMFMCLIICLSIPESRNTSLDLLLLLAICLFVMYLLFVVAHYRKWKTIDYVLHAGEVIIIFVIIGLILGFNNSQDLGNIMLCSIGFFLVYEMFLFAHFYDWKMDFAYSSSGIIISTCVLIYFYFSLGHTPYIKYGYIAFSGILVSSLVYLIMAYEKKEYEFIFLGVGIVMGLTLLTCVVLVIIDYPIILIIILAIIIGSLIVLFFYKKGCADGWIIIIFRVFPSVFVVLLIISLFNHIVGIFTVFYVGLWVFLYVVYKNHECDDLVKYPIWFCLIMTICWLLCVMNRANEYEWFSNVTWALWVMNFWVVVVMGVILYYTKK